MRGRGTRDCECAPGNRCQPCTIRGRATLLLLRVAPDRRADDPVTYWDRRTSLADARTALCIAAGVPLDRIRSASGHKELA